MATTAGIESPRDILPPMHDQTKIKRRELRKGTHSCWECKRRKMRCVVEPNTKRGATICQGCRRRGSACVSQEVPEEIAFLIINANSADGLATISTDISGVGENTINPLTPASTVSRPSAYSHAPGLENAVDVGSLHSPRSVLTVSQQLYAALPSLEDLRRIQQACPLPDVPAHELMTMPYTTLLQEGLWTIPCQVDSWITQSQVDAQWHPVLIARYMLMLASSLQHLDPAHHPEIRGLSRSPQAIAEHLSRVANQHVTSRDEMMGSIEALECVLIESVYQANLGNLRHSWMIARRALSIAQLMGLDKPSHRAQYQVLDSRRTPDLRRIWRRIVFLDRFLCIMLSLPPACPDTTWTQSTGTKSSTGERLERIHCMIASRILQTSTNESAAVERKRLQELDFELQRAARSLPTRWWLVPRLDGSRVDSRKMFQNTGRIFAQVLHYNLLYRLHLPYVFRTAPTDHTYEYSRMTCANASREILTRFLALRSFNGIASSCRIIDFIALMAALTLLLSHLHLQASATENFLAHQYHTDRAMIEQVHESMEQAHQLKSDPLSARSADLLGRLMAIDIDNGNEDTRITNRINVYPGADTVGSNDRDTQSANGTNEFTEVSNMETDPSYPSTGLSSTGDDHDYARSGHWTSGLSSGRGVGIDDAHPRNSRSVNVCPELEGMENSEENTVSVHIPYFGVIKITRNTTLNLTSNRSVPLPDSVTPQGVYPGIAADVEDWAFQGVDFALFDTIMQSIDNSEADLGAG